MLNREELVRRFNPILNSADTDCPMTVGNGSFAFNADITGLQTFYKEYEARCPLLTMSEYIWHTTPNEFGGTYTLNDLELTEYEYCGRKVHYPTDRKDTSKEIYDWLRENPHRANLFRLAFTMDGKPVENKRLSRISQKLDMYTGILSSRFMIDDDSVVVTTVVGNDQTLAVRVESRLCERGLGIEMEFPYPSARKSASDFEKEDMHSTALEVVNEKYEVLRCADDMIYFASLCGNVSAKLNSKHVIDISPNCQDNITLVISISKSREEIKDVTFKQIVDESRFRFYSFWNTGALIDVSSSEDERAQILEQRIITSMYQCFVQDLGFMPSQETGLTSNSWFGKFHLEMHPVHSAFSALYGRGVLLEKSLSWYKEILPKAKENAARNGFKGARWPKMVGPGGIDSPSPIAPLLIWQQPHILFLLKLLFLSRYSENRVEVPNKSAHEFLDEYRDIVLNTAEFMADFAVLNKETGRYELLPPLYSVQEKGNPEEIVSPPFETAYWTFGLRTAYEWMEQLGEKHEDWLEIADNMAAPYVFDNKYAAYYGFKDTYTQLNMDHPSMLFSYGILPLKADRRCLEESVKAVYKNWDFDSLWGWDFAILAMVLAKNGWMEEAFDVLLMDTKKNTYLANGFNAQILNDNLPLYMPGNGALLLAMTALKSCKNWYVETEGIMQYPF